MVTHGVFDFDETRVDVNWGEGTGAETCLGVLYMTQ